MNTKSESLNHAFFSVAENMKTKDAIARLLFVTISVFVMLNKPAVLDIDILEIVSVYLFTTAILRWDPIYALIGVKLEKTASKAKFTL